MELDMSLSGTSEGLQEPRPERHFETEVQLGERFTFGENWRQFLAVLNDQRIAEAEASLRTMLEVDSLQGQTFLDIGSGSGLFSLAARRLGARVHSFDYDPSSVGCTSELRRRYTPHDLEWKIERGSALDPAYLTTLGQFDVVYSWGVLHHTGQMWQALELAAGLVKPRGKLFIAIYNDQGFKSHVWRVIKRTYCRAPRWLKPFVLYPVAARLWGPTLLRDLLKLKPLASWKSYYRSRGMSPWRDVVDWVGGYPFEVARPEQIFDFFRQRGFQLCKLVTAGGGLGTNQFVFERESETQP